MKSIILFLVLINPAFINFNFAQPTHSINNIEITAEVQRELYPVVEKFLSQWNNYFKIPGLVTWRIHNKSTKSIRISFITEIPDWTVPQITTIVLNPEENRELMHAPFGINLLSNHVTVSTKIILKAKIDDKTIFDETKDIDIMAVDDMIWSMNNPWDSELFLAAWVTPNDPTVEEILAEVKEELPGVKLLGYSSPDVESEIKAIYSVVNNHKISYVIDTLSFEQAGFTHRVRLPEESISEKSANCIDLAVLFCSLFENIGLESSIVITPDNTLVGVRLARNSNETLFFETSMASPGNLFTYEAVVKEGINEYNKTAKNNLSALHIINIRRARGMRIYPLR
jgi:hypothetical protein